MKKLLLAGSLLLLLIQAASHLAQTVSNSSTLVPNTGTINIDCRTFTDADSVAKCQQTFVQKFIPINFGATTDGTGNQIFNESAADATSASIAVNGAVKLQFKVEVDDSDVELNFRPCFGDHNGTQGWSCGNIINVENIGTVSGANTFEPTIGSATFRHASGFTLDTLGAKNVILRLDITAGAAPRVSVWYSRM